mmetsp:Transcript_24842/g.50905  ORF Transcript_24842/g.50905 Transcript_24842/m.50905 type:complete len:882 (-) Transcript_24842:147-2792(-)
MHDWKHFTIHPSQHYHREDDENFANDSHGFILFPTALGSCPNDGTRVVVERELKAKKQTKITRQILKPSCSFILTLQLIFMGTQQHIFQAICAQSVDDWEWKAANNPENKFCGITYDEAQAFCYLPPQQSLPCPNGADVDCPYNLPCWTITDPCTQPPTLRPTVSPTNSPITRRSDDPTDHNFCGLGFDNLFECAVHCPGGSLDECPPGQICYFDTQCDARIEGSLLGAPTPHPTNPPVPVLVDQPDPASPSAAEPPQSTSESEEVAEGEADPPVLDGPQDPDKNFCGPTFNDAAAVCSRETNCRTGLNEECPEGEYCWSFIPDCDIKNMPTPAPTISFSPTPAPSPKPQTDIPTAPRPTDSPITKDDIRNFFFCGIDWMDASTRCYKQCLSGHHIECPEGEQCFAQAECKKGVIPQTPQPTTSSPTEMTGTHPPTSSFLPTPYPTTSPKPTETIREPTESPTTSEPTNRPTYGTCEGQPCPNPEYCRSPQDFCGPGEAYCTEHSTWTKECDDRTDAPTTATPTTIWPSWSPSSSLQPSETPNPTGSPSKLSNVIYYLNTESPTISHSPTTATDSPTKGEFISEAPTVDLDNMVFEPDDARASFFCGTDWNHAITECPKRCPSGESTQCPEGWSCYAFTPCVGIGQLPATAKPTWEPTRQPTPSPTPGPTPTQYGWSVQNENDEVYGSYPPTVTDWSTSWTNPPTPKPSFAPTEDQCRALPCEYQGECRSKLGFCGTGIVYCNSQSSWIPSCDPNVELPVRIEKTPTTAPVGGPTAPPTPAPTTAWDAWVNSKSTTTDDGGLEAEAALNTTANKTADDESEGESGSSDSENDIGWFNSAFGNDEEFESWWKQQSSLAPSMSSFLLPLCMALVAGLCSVQWS